MAVPIPIQFFVKTVPTDKPGNVQELLNALGAALGTTFTPQSNYILGQQGGVLPQSNVGPWANNNTWWFWNGSSYVRGNDGVPVGVMAYWGGQGTPDNWLVCDGSEVLRASYPLLFQVLQTAWGGGDGVTTFNLPPKAVFYCNDGTFVPAPQVPLSIVVSNQSGKGFGLQGGAQVAALLSDANMPQLNVTIAFTWTGLSPTSPPKGTGVANLYPASQTNLTFYAYQVLDENGGQLQGQAQTQFAIMPPFAAANVIIKAL